jgi:hypothetical protein
MNLKLSINTSKTSKNRRSLTCFSGSLVKSVLVVLALTIGSNLFAQTGTWDTLARFAPDYNQGVMLLLTDGRVLCHDASGGGQGKGWDILTPDATGSYYNGTWTQAANSINDRLFFASQVLPSGKVFTAGGEYGAGATHGEVYDPVANTWTATGGVVSGMNIYDGNSEILANGNTLVGLQNGSNPSFDDQFFNPGTNAWSTAPIAPLNHDEAAWVKLPDNSILFVGIGGTASCRYIPGTNSWVADANCSVSLYDPYGEEAGAAIMLPNGKAIFFGARGQNAIYTPSGSAAPGSWATAASFPVVGGNQLATVDAPACMLPNGHILCALSPAGYSPSNEFRSPVYFYEYNYVTNTFAQVTSQFTGLGADSINGLNCDFCTMLLLPTGQVLFGINQTGISNYYWIYTPGSGPIPQGKPVINNVYQTACGPNYYITGKVFNGISEGAAFGDDWQMSTNYPLVRLVNGANTYYCKTTNWNRLGAVQTDSLEDTAQFSLPAGLPPGTYQLYVVVNGFPSSPWTFTTYGVTTSVLSNVTCFGGSNGDAQATVTGGSSPFTYKWSNASTTVSTTNPSGSVLTAGTYTVTVTDKNGCTTTATVVITQPASFTVTTGSITNVKCNGGATGSATATPAGGSSPFTYAWTPSGGSNPTATNLSAGTYTITVTDKNGCTATATAIITQPTALTVTANTTVNVSCNGGSNGSVSSTPAGGTSPYTYAWSGGGTNPTKTGLSAGTYTITVTDKNGCTATASTSVTQPIALTVTTGSIVNVNCNGAATGKATATPAGGTGTYTYSWAPSGGAGATASGLTAGTYTVTVKDANGCSTTATATITQPTALTLTTTFIPVKCNGGSTGSATGTPGGGTPAYTYAWAPSGGNNPTATGLSAGTYTLTVKDANGCSITATATVTQPLVLTVTTTVVNEKCNGGATGSSTGTASGGTAAYTYAWTPSGGTNATASNLTAGTYTITVTDKNGCTATAKATITQPVALTVTIVNTPEKCNGGATGKATATPAGGTGAYTYNWTPSGGANAVASNLTAGTYTVTVTDANGCTATANTTITQPTAISIATSSTPATCGSSNGSATATPSGGTGSYTYAWAPGGQTKATATGLSAATYTITVTDGNGCTATASVGVTNTGSLAVTTSVTNEKCNGDAIGTADAIPSGGTAPYTYNWTPSGGTNANANALTAGTYTITVTDKNGCTATATAVITQPAALTVAVTNTPVKCNGAATATATATPAGGTGTYTYNWTPSGGANPTATNLTAGTYTITVTDANGCTKTATTIITQPTVLTATTTTTSSTCGGSNGSATVTAGGGTGAYTYNWTPSGGTKATASNLSAATYTITVTDANGCTKTATATVGTAGSLSVTTSNTNEKCNGDATASATATPGGGTAPYTYAWTPSGGATATASGLTAGSYTITVTDKNGCVATASATITQPLALALLQGSNNTTLGNCNGSAWVTVNGGTSPYTYLWSPGGATADTIKSICNGNYCCTVTDNNGCVDSVCINVVTGIPVISNSNPIKIFPDPNNGLFTISGLTKGYIVELYNYVGQELNSNVVADPTMQFNIADKPNGIYLVRIITKDGQLVEQAKLIKVN